METILERIKERIPDNTAQDVTLAEYVRTITDRLKLRLGETELPALFDSVVVDAVVKMYRRLYYEGISSESADTITTSFVDDILAEYDKEIEAYRQEHSKRKVRFL